MLLVFQTAVVCGVLHVARDKYDLVNATMCAATDNGYHPLDCVERTCEACGVDQLDDLLLGVEDKVSSILFLKNHAWHCVD